MAYNRWLSGSQQYQSNDVLHYGRLGMKWGKHIFGIPESLFQKLKIGPGTDIKSLQTLLQRGEIDFNTFKQLTNRQNMFNQIVNRGRSTGFTDNAPTKKESPTHETVRRSGQQMKDIGESVKKDAEERNAREEKYRKIAENKAMQGRQDEFQIQQRQKAEAKKKDELDRAHANSRRTSNTETQKTSTSQPKAQSETQKTSTSQPKTQPETQKTSTTQPKTQPENQQPTDEELEENLYRALSNYLTGTADETEEEKKKREAEEAKKKAEEEKKRKEEEERKKREKTEKEVKILKKICKYLNFGRIPIHP